jgi:hypothetical protein
LVCQAQDADGRAGVGDAGVPSAAEAKSAQKEESRVMNSQYRMCTGLVSVLAFVLATSGFATEPFHEYHKKIRDRQFAEQGGYGSNLTVDYKAAINEFFETKLKDPDSAHIKIAAPRLSWYRQAWLFHPDGLQIHFWMGSGRESK